MYYPEKMLFKKPVFSLALTWTLNCTFDFIQASDKFFSNWSLVIGNYMCIF